MKLCLCFLSLLIAAQCLADGPRITSAPSEFGHWPVAFVRNGSIWTAKGDGSGQKLMVRGGGTPCWLADKKKLAFYRAGNIWMANADGSSQQQLTRYGAGHCFSSSDVTISHNARTGAITFSIPDGHSARTIAGGERCYVSGASIIELYSKGRGRFGAFVRFDVSDSGSGFSFNDNAAPAWSRSGSVLAFTRNGDIWAARYSPGDTSGRPGWDITRLAAVARYDSPTYRASRENVVATQMSWSPDCSLLAYCMNRLGGSGTAQLYVAKVVDEGTPWLKMERTDMLLDEHTPGPGDLVWQPDYPSFSPDGKWIAFSSEGNTYAISLDGARVVRIAANATRLVW